MPWSLLYPYIAALPGLRAEDALHWASVGMAGSGNLKRDAHRRMIRQWERETQRLSGASARPRPRGPQDVMASLAALGVRTEVIKK